MRNMIVIHAHPTPYLIAAHTHHDSTGLISS